jgi:hypothetical protein
MSTYFFKTNIDDTGTVVNVKPHLDKLEESKEIEHWRVHMQDKDHVLEIETDKMSPEEVQRYLRGIGVDADFTRPPRGESTR